MKNITKSVKITEEDNNFLEENSISFSKLARKAIEEKKQNGSN